MKGSHTNSFLPSNLSWSLILAWFALIAITSWTSAGWLQPDEHARVLEPAHFVAYGYASLPWEFHQDTTVVSWLLGYLLSPVFFVTKIFGATGTTEAFAMRLVTGLISSTRLLALLKIFDRLQLKKARSLLYLAICALAIYGPMIFVRTSQENYATTALIWAFVLHFDVVANNARNHKQTILFAFLLALSTACRLQVGPSAAALGLYTLWRTGSQIILPATLGVSLGLLPMAIVDTIKTGTPFLPAWGYLSYALGNEDGGKIWGTSPWWFYIREFFEAWYPPLSIILIVPLFMGIRFCAALCTVIVPFTLVHFILGHKETRYFSPMIPFFQLATFLGWEKIEAINPTWLMKLKSWRKLSRTLLGLFIFAGIFTGAVELNTSPSMYSKLGDLSRAGLIDSYTYVGNTKTEPSKFYMKIADDQRLTQQMSLDNVRDHVQSPVGWAVFYAIDPRDFSIIDTTCKVVYLSISPFQLRLLSRLPPNVPIRRRINTIAFCQKPLELQPL